MATPAMEVIFRCLTDKEEDAGYRVIIESVAWQQRKNIDLWNEPLPRDVYSKRQQRQENYGLFLEGELAAVASLLHSVPAYWRADVDDPNAIWLCTLATAKLFHGKNVGRLAVEKSLNFLRKAGHALIYADCAPGFLKEFYESLGFERVIQGMKMIPHVGGPFEVVLLKKRLT